MKKRKFEYFWGLLNCATNFNDLMWYWNYEMISSIYEIFWNFAEQSDKQKSFLNNRKTIERKWMKFLCTCNYRNIFFTRASGNGVLNKIHPTYDFHENFSSNLSFFGKYNLQKLMWPCMKTKKKSTMNDVCYQF